MLVSEVVRDISCARTVLAFSQSFPLLGWPLSAEFDRYEPSLAKLWPRLGNLGRAWARV